MRSTGKKDSLDQFAMHARSSLPRTRRNLCTGPSAAASSITIWSREDALFNHAKLAFETDFNPFNDAIAAFEQYLEEYPTASCTRPTGSSSMFTDYLQPRAGTDALDRIQRSPREKQATRSWPLTMVDLFRSGNLQRQMPLLPKPCLSEDATLPRKVTIGKVKSPSSVDVMPLHCQYIF